MPDTVDFVIRPGGNALKKKGQKFSHLGDLILYDPTTWFSVLYASPRAGFVTIRMGLGVTLLGGE